MPTKKQIAEVEAIIDADKGLMTEALAELIRIPSKTSPALPGMPYGKQCADALAVALKRAESLGFSTNNCNNILGWAEFGEGTELLAVLAHLDVVPEGDGWTADPFGAEIVSGRMYGRGTQDDKGPAIAALFAMSAIKKAGLKTDRRVRLILGCDEENGSSDMAYYAQNCELPGLCFSPDAEYPVVNGEKGMLRVSVRGSYPVNDKLPRVLSASGGDRINIVAPKSTAVIAGMDYSTLSGICSAISKQTGVTISLSEELFESVSAIRVSIAGKGAHAATPEEGNSANTVLFALLAALPLADGAISAQLAELIRLFPHGDTRGYAAKIAVKDDVSGELTCNPGLFELGESGFTAKLDIRYPITADGGSIFAALKTVSSLVDISLSADVPPHYVPPESSLVKGLLSAYTDVTGKEGYCFSIGGGTYARVFDGGVSFGCLFPGGEDRMHKADEYISIDELVLNAKIISRAIINLACS